MSKIIFKRYLVPNFRFDSDKTPEQSFVKYKFVKNKVHYTLRVPTLFDIKFVPFIQLPNELFPQLEID